MGSKSWITLFLLSSLHLALGVNGRIRDPTSILKTIENKDGEVIDCVDIHKQPAFSHPRLANHALQMKPISYPIGLEQKSTSEEVNFQFWHKNGEYCPEGKIPIVRSSEKNFPQKTRHPMVRSSSRSTNDLTPGAKQAEYAVACLSGSNYTGAIGDINVWNPKTQDKELSTAQFWITDSQNTDTIEAGWTVSTDTNHPTLFVYFTPDDYQTGCYNLGCPGFVQTSNKVTLGGWVDPSSTYGGEQHLISIKIFRDNNSGNWWFNIQGQDLGYWPPNIFNGGLKGMASLIEWGGMIVDANPQGNHTTTQMGSGHFPEEGHTKAAWFRKLKYIADDGEVEDANEIYVQATAPSCYDIELKNGYTQWGAHFYYGGPGLSPICP